jgi:hypothetical protein
MRFVFISAKLHDNDISKSRKNGEMPLVHVLKENSITLHSHWVEYCVENIGEIILPSLPDCDGDDFVIYTKQFRLIKY